MPFYPQSVASQGVCPNSLLFHYFHFRLTFESIKELGSASKELHNKRNNQEEQHSLKVGVQEKFIRPPSDVPNSLRDSNVSPKQKTTERQRVGARSLAYNTLEG